MFNYLDRDAPTRLSQVNPNNEDRLYLPSLQLPQNQQQEYNPVSLRAYVVRIHRHVRLSRIKAKHDASIRFPSTVLSIPIQIGLEESDFTV